MKQGYTAMHGQPIIKKIINKFLIFCYNTQPHVRLVPGLFHGPGNEIGHLLTSGDDPKNAWSPTSVPSCALNEWFLIGDTEYVNLKLPPLPCIT